MTPTPGDTPGPPRPAPAGVGAAAAGGAGGSGRPGCGPGEAAGYVAAAKAANTRFAGWCADRELATMPATPATLGAYLTAAATDPDAAGYTPATLARWVAAVNFCLLYTS